MIVHIEEIAYRDINNDPRWKTVPIVPGTATLTRTSSPDENKGDIEKIEIYAVIKKYLRELSRDLIVYVALEDMTGLTIGTEDHPATFEVKQANNVTIKLEYERVP